MSNEPKHTATPWELNPTTDGVSITSKVGVIVFCYDVSIPDYDKKIPKANAARIVQCVNEYDGLIETIESLRAENAELIEALRSIIAQWDTPNWKLTESTGTIINQARQTLAKYEKP